MYKKALSVLFLLITFICSSQDTKTSTKWKLYKIGLFYGYGNEKNLLFDSADYFHEKHLIKGTFYFKLSNRSWVIDLNIQPQVHFIKHQLLNIDFVIPGDRRFIGLDPNTLLNEKSMQLYALQAEIIAKKNILKWCDIYAFFGVGPGTIDTKTERMEKGFTFIENLGIGISFELINNFFLDLKPSYHHTSNADLKKLNIGYDSMNIEIGLSFEL